MARCALRAAAILGLAALCGGLSLAGAVPPAECERWKQQYAEADTVECVDFVHERAQCVTAKAKLREKLVRHCRDRQPIAEPQRLYNITIVVPSANRREAVLHRTLDSLWAALPMCRKDRGVHVAVYNVGDHRNEGFFRSNEFRNNEEHGCASFVEWFHAHEQPFPELPYIAEEGPDWEQRRDIPAKEHIDQTFDYLSILRDAYWFYPARAYLLLEDDFEVCAGAMDEILRVQSLLEAGEPTWGGVQFSYGGNGWLVNRGFLRQLAAYLHENAYSRPVDLLVHTYFGSMRRPVFASDRTLFAHTGTVSTFHDRKHEPYPACGERNSAMHFRNAFVPCPYRELAAYLCDWPHASVMYQTHGAPAPAHDPWTPPPAPAAASPPHHSPQPQQSAYAGRQPSGAAADADAPPAAGGGSGQQQQQQQQQAADPSNPYAYSPQQALHAHADPAMQQALHFQAQQQQQQAYMMHQYQQAMHQQAAHQQALHQHAAHQQALHQHAAHQQAMQQAAAHQQAALQEAYRQAAAAQAM